MAVASGPEALDAVSALINHAPVRAGALLREPYLPPGLAAATDPVLCDEETWVGGYGDEARYRLSAADPETAAAIAGSPASVLAEARGTRPDRVRAYLTSSLDLTMQGGTTSGVVYPLAVCELATGFRFRNVGGASAGAIAASLTAAAELGRSEQLRHPDTPPGPPEPLGGGQVRRGFVGLTDVLGWLSQTQPGDSVREEFRLAQLFRPVTESRAIFRVAVAVMRQRSWSLPLVGLMAFGALPRALALALVAATVGLTGWAGTRFRGETRPWYVSLGWGLLDTATYAAGVVVLVLVGQVVVTLRADWRENRRVAADPRWLNQLREVTSAQATPQRQWLSQLIVALGLFVVVIALSVRRWPSSLAAFLVGLAGTLLLGVVLVFSALLLLRRFGDRWYGLVGGDSPPRRRSLLDRAAGLPKSTVEGSLVPWLNDCFTALAGLPAGEVLRFGHLWAGRDFGVARTARDPEDVRRWRRMADHTDERLVNLELMTTDLVRQRPYRFPLQACELDDPAQLWVDVAALGRPRSPIFPEPVLAALREGNPRTIRDTAGRELTLLPLPPPQDLPVIFAVRLSMSLPVLFQAVPLYRLVHTPAVEDDFGRAVLLENQTLPTSPVGRAPEVAEELWFSDGGITSNFPVHFFDSPLPRWPTVSLNLGQHPDTAPMQDVSLPRDFDPVAIRREPLTGSGLSLAGAVFTTAQTWRDSMQSAMPGYRNRIAQVRNRRSEGGTNLFMSREVIASMALRGALAGARLRTRFADRAQWDRFRWMRLRVALSNLERVRGTVATRRDYYADALAEPGWLCDLAGTLGDVPSGAQVLWHAPPEQFWCEAAEMLAAVAGAYTPGEVNLMTTKVPRPEPALRQVAQE